MLVEGKERSGALEGVIIGEFPADDFAEDDAQGEDIRWEVELFADEDFGRHIRVRTAERQSLALLLITGGNPSKAKICDFEAEIGSN